MWKFRMIQSNFMIYTVCFSEGDEISGIRVPACPVIIIVVVVVVVVVVIIIIIIIIIIKSIILSRNISCL